jgi:TonB family protein
MFETLLASRSHQTTDLPGWALPGAVLLHVIAIAAALQGHPRPSERAPIVVEGLLPPVEPAPPRGGGSSLWLPPAHPPTSLPLPPSGDVPAGLALGPPVLSPAGPPTLGVPSSGDGIEDPLPVSIVQEPPVLLAAPVPEYPARLREAGIEGDVVVEVVVDTMGRAEAGTVRIVQSSDAAFQPSALGSIGAARFRPARLWGRAVRVLVRVPVAFRLRR